MDKNLKNNQVILTVNGHTYSEGFVARAIEFALKNGLVDQYDVNYKGEFSMAIQTPVGQIISRPMVETDSYLGFWTDWLVDGEFVALSTSEYQKEENVFVTHEYADFSEDSPSRSITHYFDREGMTDAESVLRLLRQES
jgi:hypothetical protein